jgi:enoyl-CoA hydratase/carnithine racemase
VSEARDGARVCEDIKLFVRNGVELGRTDDASENGMIYNPIIYEVRDHLAFVTFNKPEKLNAFSASMSEATIAALTTADEDDEVRAVVVTGSGAGFCAGDDLSGGSFEETDNIDEKGLEGYRDYGGVLTLKIFNMNKPVIAAINGHAVGIGLTMTLPMDYRIAADNAKMGFVFSRRGIVMGECSSWFLPRLIGIARALDLAITGRVFSAKEALEYGLVNRVVPQNEVLPAAIEIAAEIRDNTSPVSVALIRHLLWRMLSEDHPIKANKMESKCLFHVGHGIDVIEGVKSFMEKRPPEFRTKLSKGLPNFFPWWDEPSFK